MHRWSLLIGNIFQVYIVIHVIKLLLVLRWCSSAWLIKLRHQIKSFSVRGLSCGVSMLMVISTRLTTLLFSDLQFQSCIHFVALPLRSWRCRLEPSIRSLSISSPFPSTVKAPISIAWHGCLLAISVLIIRLLDLPIRRIAFILINGLIIIARKTAIIYLLRCVPCVCTFIFLLTSGPHDLGLILNNDFFE